LAELESFPSLGEGPDLVKASRYQWRVPSERTGVNAWTPDTVFRDVEPWREISEKDIARPTLLIHAWPPGNDVPAWVVEWQDMVWPYARKAISARGVYMLSKRIDSKASAWSPNYAYLHSMYLTDTPFDETASLATLVGLCGMDQDAAGVAKDVLTCGIADGRIVPETMASAVSILSGAYWFKVNRLTPRLADVGETSPLHAWVICRVLEQFSRACANLGKDGHHIFAPLLELSVLHGFAMEEATVDMLSTLKGSGKSAKLAKQLLALTENEGAMAGVNALILETSIDRAVWWANHE
jgi:hypothetical protein